MSQRQVHDSGQNASAGTGIWWPTHQQRNGQIGNDFTMVDLLAIAGVDLDLRGKRLGTDDCAEHGLKLCLGFSEFRKRFAVGNNAAACNEACTFAIGAELGAPNGNRPCAVAGRVNPSDSASVASSFEPFDVADQIEGCSARVASECGRG
jgi:hypothetical protein